MLLAVDANVLVAELLRERGRELLRRQDLRLVVAAEAWGEAQHELGKRVPIFAAKNSLDESEANELFDSALEVAKLRVRPVPQEEYAEFQEQATYRIPQDSDDVPTVALALAFGGDEGRCGIWTVDRDFLGCGIPTWTTDTLLDHLDYLSRRAE